MEGDTDPALERWGSALEHGCWSPLVQDGKLRIQARARLQLSCPSAHIHGALLQLEHGFAVQRTHGDAQLDVSQLRARSRWTTIRREG